MVRRFDDREHRVVDLLAGVRRIVRIVPEELHFVNGSQRARLPIVGGEHVFVVGVPDAAGRQIGEDVLSSKRRHRLAVVDEPAADRVAATRTVAVLDDRIRRHHHRAGRLFANPHRNLVDLRQRRGRVVGFEQLVAFAFPIAVVGPLVNDVDRFPCVEPDRVGDQPIVGRVGGIDGPVQPMGIAEAVGPDFRAGTRRRDERIVVGNSITAVRAHRACRRVFAQIGNDAQYFPFEVVEPLWVGPDGDVRRFSRRAVTTFHVQDPPVRIASTSRRIEDEIAERVTGGVELHAQQLAGRSFERRIGRVRIGPLDQHSLVLERARRFDRFRRRVAGDLERGETRIVGKVGAGERGILHVNGVEPAVAGVVRVQVEAVQPVSEPDLRPQLAEDAAHAFVAVEVEIDRELPGVLVQDVQRSVEVADEEALRTTDLFAQRVDSREQLLVRYFAIDQSGHRQDQEVPELQRRLRRCRPDPEDTYRESEARDP